MGMKHTWFHHTDCTTQQAEELMAEYQRRGVKFSEASSKRIAWAQEWRASRG